MEAAPCSREVAKLIPEPDDSILGDGAILPIMCQVFPHCLKQVPNSSWHQQKNLLIMCVLWDQMVHIRDRNNSAMCHAPLQLWVVFLVRLDEEATVVEDKCSI